MTFFETQTHLPQHRPKPRDPDLNALVASQIFLQFDQRPIRLLFHPRSQILDHLAGDPALPPSLPAAGGLSVFPVRLRAAEILAQPSLTRKRSANSQAAFSLLMRFQKLSTQII